jgi:hypothetical protein
VFERPPLAWVDGSGELRDSTPAAAHTAVMDTATALRCVWCEEPLLPSSASGEEIGKAVLAHDCPTQPIPAQRASP